MLLKIKTSFFLHKSVAMLVFFRAEDFFFFWQFQFKLTEPLQKNWRIILFISII